MPIDHLPRHWQPPLERLRAVLLTDAGAMMILGAAILTRGISYRDLGTVVLFHPLDVALPLWVDSALWTSVGVVLLVAAPWHARWFGRLALSAATGLLTLWGLLFILAPPAQFTQRGVMYIALGLVTLWAVWRGRRGEIRVEGVADAGGRKRR